MHVFGHTSYHGSRRQLQQVALLFDASHFLKPVMSMSDVADMRDGIYHSDRFEL